MQLRKSFTFIFLGVTLMMVQGARAQDGTDACAPQDPPQNPEPEHPWKDGDFWDQGTVGACVTTSIVNMNIDLFGAACDAKGKLWKAIQNCMFKKGHTETWLRGIDPTGPEGEDLRKCKKEALLAICEKEVEWSGPEVNPGFPPGGSGGGGGGGGTPGGFTRDPDGSGPGRSPCKKVQDALNKPQPDGVWMNARKDGLGHRFSVRSIDCSAKKITIRNPNTPNQPETYDFNDDGTLSGGTPSSSMNGWTIHNWFNEAQS